MSEAPKDPLAFDFGFDFKPSHERVQGESVERVEMGKRALKYHLTFLDDCLRGISPNDLVLIGAETGAGKTECVRSIAVSNARIGKRVYYFALEAAPSELERRTKYEILIKLLARDRNPGIERMNYPDWYYGRCEDVCGKYNADAERMFALEYRSLHTYYRGSKFDHDDIKRLFLAIQSEADLIILDHLHYVDIDDENENRGFKKTIQMIRNVALGMGRPVLLVAHLRKRDLRGKAIVPDISEFHGSSEISKNVTHAVLFAPARSMPSSNPRIARTFMHVPKDRIGGATGLVALLEFDRLYKRYGENYTLGRTSYDGSEFEPLGSDEVPEWAKHHQAMYVPMDAGSARPRAARGTK